MPDSVLPDHDAEHAVWGLRALAVLSVEMPVLRFQQPRAPRADRRAAFRARIYGRDRLDRRARARPHGVHDLLRRRHAVTHATGDGRRVLDAIAQHWTVAPDAEVTLEANPTSVEAARFRGYRSAGINRVSLGVQALDDRALAELGRLHTAREALDAVHIAQSAFERTSFDLIYARPQQTPREWEVELKRAIAEAGEHLSLYQLTVEAETPFAALHAAGKLKTPDDDAARALYDTTQDVCAAHGLPAYEVSNHARPGAECRHNLVYWRAHEYAGIGPGAHGRLDIDGDRHATATEKRPEAWLERVESHGHGLITDDVLLRQEMADEFLLMGLRLAEGIDPQRYAALAGRSLDAARIATLRDNGFVEMTAAGRLRVSMPGFPVLDAVVADLAA